MVAIACGANSVGWEPLFTPASPLDPNSCNIIASSGQSYTLLQVPQSFKSHWQNYKTLVTEKKRECCSSQ